MNLSLPARLSRTSILGAMAALLCLGGMAVGPVGTSQAGAAYHSDCSYEAGGSWGRWAHYTVFTSRGMSCRRTLTYVVTHEPKPRKRLYKRGSHRVRVGHFRCRTYAVDPGY